MTELGLKMLPTSRFIIIVLFFLVSEFSLAEKLKPFTSDGCSAFPNGTLKQNKLWLHCCTAHDLSYWKGGTYAERKQADQELHTCVNKAGEPEIAALMLTGVRMGGSPIFPTSFRWGYGWSYPKFYGELSENEINLVNKTSPKTKASEDSTKTK